MSNILIVDDDQAHRSMLKTLIRGWGYDTEEVDDGLKAVEKVKETSFDLVLTDVRMAQMDGITALAQIHEYNPSLPVIIMTAWSTVDKAMEALRLGAADYLTKPLDFDVLRFALTRVIPTTENGKTLTDTESTANSLGRSPVMRELTEFIKTIAPTDATILITGESGTGKEIVARSIQKLSLREDKPFVTLNCAALAENLLESELFGHEKGAFTGADKSREGRFLQAHTGTLFLDEIGEMPLPLQAKLLRVLQQGEVQKLGSDKIVHVDVRIIAATNRNLAEEVKNNRFREDLYYRLNVIAIHVYPLRERREDIPYLAHMFLKNFNVSNRKHIKDFTPQAMDALLKYSWNGNVRELENAIERAVILSSGDYISERSLPLTIQQFIEQNKQNLQETSNIPVTSLEDIEKNAIITTLKETGDNKSETARRLGITRATLHNKLKKYALE